MHAAQKDGPTRYYDGSTAYLELHALRAPVGGYVGAYAPERDAHGLRYDRTVGETVGAFQEAHGVRVYLLGRSGRHVCIDDTPANRRRYPRLRRAAIDAAHAMWAHMRGRS